MCTKFEMCGAREETFPKMGGASTARNAGPQDTRQDTRRCEVVLRLSSLRESE